MSAKWSQLYVSSPTTSFTANDIFCVSRSGVSYGFLYSSFIPVNTKGDLFAWSTAATRLAVGTTNGQILQVSSGAATGLAWSTATYPSTNTLGDIVYSSSANVYSNLSGNVTAVKQYLSQTGTGVVSAAPAWATISGSDITGAALTKTDDTNVTLTLGGTPSTALLRAASITAGWTGQLSLTRGGTNASLTASNGGIVYSTASAFAILSGTATAGQVLQSGSNAAPTWSTATYPATASSNGTILQANGTNWVATTATYPATTTINQILYSSSANTVAGITTANSAVLITNASGVPSFTGTMTNGQLVIGNTGNPPTLGTLTQGSGINITNGAGTITISATGGGVTSITGTANQVIASASTGDVTLSTPQDIGTASSPTFAGATLTGLSTISGQSPLITIDGSNIIKKAQTDYEVSWTPTDASGAGLTFDLGQCKKWRNGNMVTITAVITYPTTADASGCMIGSLPYNYSQRFCNVAFSPDAGIAVMVTTNTDDGNKLLLYNTVTGAGLLNVNMSGKTIFISLSYNTTDS